MEILLTNSLFFLYLLGALAIFNYGAFDKNAADQNTGIPERAIF